MAFAAVFADVGLDATENLYADNVFHTPAFVPSLNKFVFGVHVVVALSRYIVCPFTVPFTKPAPVGPVAHVAPAGHTGPWIPCNPCGHIGHCGPCGHTAHVAHVRFPCNVHVPDIFL